MLIRFTAWYSGEAELEMLNVSQVTAVLAIADDVAGAAEVSVETEEPLLVFCADSCSGSCFTTDELMVDGGLTAGGSVPELVGEDTVGLEWADSHLGEDLGGSEPGSGWGSDAFRVRGSQGTSLTGLLVEPVASLFFTSDDPGGVVGVDDFADGVTSGEFKTLLCS